LTYLWIALGSALGGCARFAITSYIGNSAGFPWGTLAVNVAGCFVIGVLASTIESLPWKQFLMIGFCGGFTTFSSFGLETLALLREGQTARAAAYVAASVAICLAAVWAGHASAR
jgi:fluoride exporter